jgi:hypothetical protein
VNINLTIWKAAIYCTLVAGDIVMVSRTEPWLTRHGQRVFRNIPWLSVVFSKSSIHPEQVRGQAFWIACSKDREQVWGEVRSRWPAASVEPWKRGQRTTRVAGVDLSDALPPPFYFNADIVGVMPPGIAQCISDLKVHRLDCK